MDTPHRLRRAGRVVTWLMAALLLAPSGGAHALSYEYGELSADLKLTLNYGVAVRTGNPSPAIINGPLDPFQLHLDQVQQGTGFTHTGYSQTINQDDSDRNFTRWSLINNRLSGVAELQLSYESYGAVFAGDGFYDRVYHDSNDNDSPRTVNKTGPVNQFSEGARYYDGRRFRLLDAYAYGAWSLTDDLRLDLRAGNQLVAWGESLFFPNISGAQSTADATKAFTPGVEVKQILLPTQQVSANLAVGEDLTLMGYYKFAFKPNEIFPVGDYFSPTDSVGPGAQFSYGALNPLYLNGCPGLLGALSNLCNVNGAGGTLFSAQPDILIPYKGELRPSNFGQYGLGLKYQLTSRTNAGLYWLRYHDPNPSVVFTSGYPVVGTSPTVITTQAFNEPTASEYRVKYFDGIDMAATSFSTVAGPFNIAGEVSYKRHASIAIQTLQLGTISPGFVRGEVAQAQLSAIYAANPHVFFDDVAIVGETGYLHVTRADSFPAQPGIIPVGIGNSLFYSRNAWAFQLLALPTKRALIEGWDLTTPITFGYLVEGNPSVPGAFGALYGAGDKRLSVGLSLQYLQNLQIGFNYNFFFGDPEKRIGDSFLKQNPYADRDYMSLNIKYSI